uniref:EF-hand domain-containing protein n=1 Tax=Globisporangium ultimum (strain ATCC 200006 / CBS 805.95 / DAOM BR144) TaxID=431595 RepID=K3WQ20_GLOUD
MQFTPQQLVGAGRYAPVTRIGNWNEDLMLEEARMKEFQLRKKQGSLLATHKLKHDFLHQSASRSFDARNELHFNHAVGLGHVESQALLACNVFEETPSIGSGEYVVTATTSTKAMARTTFRIVSPQAWKESQASGHGFQYDKTAGTAPVCYGEPLFIMCNEALLVDDKSVLLKPPLFLKTGLKTERSMSPISYNQRIWMSSEADSSALWICERADLAATEKLLAAGTPVRAGDPIAIVHKMTGQPLFVDAKSKQPADFGVELEMCAHGAKNAGKYHNIAAEAIGTRTADTEGRLHLTPNIWTFLFAKSAQEAVDERPLPDFASPAAVVYVIQRCLMTASLYAFRGFLVELMRAVTNGTGHLNREEAKWKIKSYKLPLRDEHLDLLFDSFDKRNAGHFPIDSLLSALRVPVSFDRKQQIEAAYDRLARQTENGKLTIADLMRYYDPSIDSRVGANVISAENAVSEYRNLWSQQIPSAEISRREFLEVYTDISMVIANDAHFQQMLAESWKSA